MRLRFTKMQGAGNDFVVLDATTAPLALSQQQLRHLGDRRFGVGADQILLVEPAREAEADFGYRIFNGASGEEVEHCGNGARCFARYVKDRGWVRGDEVRVSTVNNQLVLHLEPDGRVTVNMNEPRLRPQDLPFDASGLQPRRVGQCELWPLEWRQRAGMETPAPVEVALVSMGNPHAVLRVRDVDTAPVETLGPRIETHPRFPRRVNAGFAQCVNRQTLRVRVFERDAGETLACGTGACAAMVALRLAGELDERVDVHLRGGTLTLAWAGVGSPVWMTGPAETVYEGEIEL